jgi:hypothetical protein
MQKNLFSRYDVRGLPAHAKTRGKAIDKNHIVSKLNRQSFFQQQIQLICRGKDEETEEIIEFVPHLCDGTLLTCVKTSPGPTLELPSGLTQPYLLFKDNEGLIIVKPETTEVDGPYVTFQLPDHGTRLSSRRTQRHPCPGITFRLTSDYFCMNGRLADFHAFSFNAEIEAKESDIEVSDGLTLEASLYRSDLLVYSGQCRVLRQGCQDDKSILVLEPIATNRPLLAAKKYRPERVKPVPSFQIYFIHPLTGKATLLDIVEISGTGFSVNENERQATLMPGMVIPDVELRLSNIFNILCSVRVIQRQSSTENHALGKLLIFGCVFTDMAMKDHTNLVAYLQQVRDPKTLVCSTPDMKALWDFFFTTGFIYPHKYRYLCENRRRIQDTFNKLYLERPETSRHFIVQERGVITAHISLQRVYRKTWMMHHMAARSEAGVAGIKVLSLIGSFINNSYFLDSNRMKYAILYYRPENKFPDKVFGGVVRKVNNPKICSLDTFAYFHIDRSESASSEPTALYTLRKPVRRDLESLGTFYEMRSGGLMLDAMDLGPDRGSEDELEVAYERVGLRRERQLYALEQNGETKAIIMIYISEIGLNLSELTNCIHVFVIEPESLDLGVLNAALTRISTQYDQRSIPVNLFPAVYADHTGLSYEKHYTLWSYEMRYSDHYYEYLKRLSRFFKH